MASKSYSFSRQERLKESAEYQLVFQQNISQRDEYWVTLYRPNGRTRSRLGLAIAKKNVRMATQRNRIKRIVRESFRQHALTGFDIIVLARPGISQITNAKLFSSLDRLWQKLNKKGC